MLNVNPLQSAAVTKLNTNQQQTGINQNMEKCISFILKFAVDLTFRPWRAEPSSADLKIILKIAVSSTATKYEFLVVWMLLCLYQGNNPCKLKKALSHPFQYLPRQT